MIKLVYVLERRADVARADFHDYWLNALLRPAPPCGFRGGHWCCRRSERPAATASSTVGARTPAFA
jgi:hypothetical protein